MGTMIINNWMKVAGVGLAFFTTVFVGNAQTADGSSNVIGKSAVAGPISSTAVKQNFAVRVIDNKGTVKYLQSNNGITTVSNIDASGNAVTTWQLGGTFTDDTKLDINGKTFSLNNMVFNADATGAATASNPGANKAAVAQGATSGYTVLVRDEATGNLLKMLVTDVVIGGNTNVKIDGTAISATVNYTFTDITLPSKVNKIGVYRNGIKMVAGVDYSVASAAGANTLTILHANGAEPEDYAFAVNDRIEIQWLQ